MRETGNYSEDSPKVSKMKFYLSVLKHFKSWLLNKLVYLPEHYTSIDEFPILKYDALKKGEGLENLLVKKRKVSRLQKIRLKQISKNIDDEFIKVFGFPAKFNLILEKKLQIAKLKLKKIITKDDSIINFINRAERELKALIGDSSQVVNEMDIYQAKIIIENHNPGLHLQLSIVPVREFYSYLKQIEKKSKNKIK